jgi:hypothetical protein
VININKNIGHKKELKSKFQYGDVVRVHPQLTTDPYEHRGEVGVIVRKFKSSGCVPNIMKYGAGVIVGQGDYLVNFVKDNKYGIYEEDALIKSRHRK